MKEFRAARMKLMALHWLRERHPDALLTTELAVGKYGDASLDVAAILPDKIVGVEIKGDGDSANRLERQGWVYSRTASEMWLFPAPSLIENAGKHRPRGWGLLRTEGEGVRVRLEVGNWRTGTHLPNAPAALLDILWKPELVATGQALNVAFNPRAACHVIAHQIAEHSTLSEVRPRVCQALIDRDWGRYPRPGMGKIVYRPGDPIPALSPQREKESDE